MVTPYKKVNYTLDLLKKCLRDRANIDKQVSEDWPRWSYAGLAGHRVEYRKRNDLRLAQIVRELLKKGITQEEIDEVINNTEKEVTNE